MRRNISRRLIHIYILFIQYSTIYICYTVCKGNWHKLLALFVVYVASKWCDVTRSRGTAFVRATCMWKENEKEGIDPIGHFKVVGMMQQRKKRDEE